MQPADEDRDELDEKEISKEKDIACDCDESIGEDFGPTDRIMSHAVNLLNNHLCRFGSATDLSTNVPMHDLLDPAMKVDVQDACSAAARFLSRVFDNS